jgi:hypothetical protein
MKTKRVEGFPEETAETEDTGEHGKNGKLPILILPGNTVKIISTAEDLFSRLAKTNKYFVRERTVFKLVKDQGGGAERLEPLTARVLQTDMERYFKPCVWRAGKNDGGPVLKPTNCPKETAESLLVSSNEIDLLPGIRVIVNSPILAEVDGQIKILNRGYHDVHGGIYVRRSLDVPEISLKDAVNKLLALLDDFLFTHPSDRSRAIAQFISPALRFGQLLGDADFPLTVGEADQSQAGKTLLQKMTALLYGEVPHVITRRNGGVGGIDESVSSAFLSGRAFIAFDNIRGQVDSQTLESALRGHGVVGVRVPYKGEIQLPTTGVIIQLTSNKAATTDDLANRALITSIKKQPGSYSFKEFPEGDLLAHVKVNQGLYYSCIASVVSEWFSRDKPRTKDGRHTFREWCQALDWIVQNLFDLPPLLDGHAEEQAQIANPYLGFLRSLAFAVEKAGQINANLQLGKLLDLAENGGIEIPGINPQSPEDSKLKLLGRRFKALFLENSTISVGGFNVTRFEFKEWDQKNSKDRDVVFYTFSQAN